MLRSSNRLSSLRYQEELRMIRQDDLLDYVHVLFIDL